MLKVASTGFLFAQQTIAKYSMLFIPPAIHRFLVVGAHASIDTRAIFRFEQTHGLAHRLSNMIKKSLVNYEPNLSRTMAAVKYQSGQPKSCQSTKQSVLIPMKEFVESTKRCFCTSGLKTNFCRKEGRQRLYEFLTKTGILGMVEAADYKKTDLVF